MKNLFPDEYYSSTYKIDFKKLYERGYRGIIFDIDNTLVGHGKPQDERSLALFSRLGELGFKFCLLSNNGETRVKSFAKPVGAKYIYRAGKPKKSGYERAIEEMGLEKKEVLFIGDQIFTDVAGARGAGLYAILVDRLYPEEEIQIHLKRILEKPVLLAYKLSGGKRK